MLTPELAIVELPTAQTLPQRAFCIGRGFAQAALERCSENRPVCFSLHGGSL
jgi:hypothetical protein